MSIRCLYFSLLWCHNDIKKEVLNVKNNDPFTRDDQTRFTMRINSELLEKVKREAEKNKRSTAKQIEFVLEQYVEALSAE